MNESVASPGINCQQQVRAERVAVLVDAANYYPQLAESLRRARQRIIVLGWDIDSRVPIERNDDGTSRTTLIECVRQVTHDNPDLRIDLLAWEPSPFLALERDPLAGVRFSLLTRERVRHVWDDSHPFAGSQHQKVVAIDDCVAFVGGIDLTIRRWDGPEHLPRSAARVDPAGTPYAPYHDLQLALSGPAARALGDLARARWRACTGEVLPEVKRGDDAPDPWPPRLEPDFRDVMVSLCRTRPRFAGQRPVREVARMFIDAIDAARRSIYIEQQFLTAPPVLRALRRRLEDRNGPEVVIVLPAGYPGGWSDRTFEFAVRRSVKGLRMADRHGRLRVVSPVSDREQDVPIFVHAKALVVDDWHLHIGSANMNQRSLGLDSECDIVIEAAGDEAVRASIRRIRDRLLAEHLGVPAERLTRFFDDGGGLCQATDALGGGRRGVVPYPSEEVAPMALPGRGFVDPGRPTLISRSLEALNAGFERRPWWVRHKFAFAAMAAAMAGLLVLGFKLGKPYVVGLSQLLQSLAETTDDPLGFALLVALFVAVSFVGVPLNFLVATLVAGFGGFPGPLIAYVATQLACSAHFGVGRLLGKRLATRLLGGRLGALAERVRRNGAAAVLLARMVPVAPALVVNLAFGAGRIRHRDFALGTALGTLPGLVVYSFMGFELARFLRQPSWPRIVALSALLVVLVAAGMLIRRLLEGRFQNAGKPLRPGEPPAIKSEAPQPRQARPTGKRTSL